MKFEIEVDADLERAILVRALKWHYDCCDNEKVHLKEDRKYNDKLRKSIDVVLDAWMTPDEYAEWKDER